LAKERILQLQVEQYLDLKRVRFIRVPDSLWAFVATKAPIWLKAFCSKFLAGMPDIVALKGSQALHLELKAKKGKMSQKQIAWTKDCIVHEVRDFDTAKRLIDEFSTDRMGA